MISVLQCLGLAPNIIRFLSGVLCFREQMDSSSDGHVVGLKSIDYADEGSYKYGVGLCGTSGLHNTPGPIRKVQQGRSFGDGVALNTQSLLDIHPSVLANMGTAAVLGCASHKEATLACQIARMPRERATDLMSLPVNQGIIWSDGFKEAVHFEFPYVDMGHYPGDEEVAAKMKEHIAALEAQCIYSTVKEEPGPAISYTEILGEKDPEDPSDAADTNDSIDIEVMAEHKALLCEIVANPEAVTTARIASLGWGAYKEQRVRKELIENGLVIERQRKGTGGRAGVVLQLTAKGKELYDAIC